VQQIVWYNKINEYKDKVHTVKKYLHEKLSFLENNADHKTDKELCNLCIHYFQYIVCLFK
jgi:hypothetical protein